LLTDSDGSCTWIGFGRRISTFERLVFEWHGRTCG
jgi:hypothetical protein